MAKYRIKVDYLAKMIVVEDSIKGTAHLFTRDRISAKPGVPLRHKEYQFSHDWQIVNPAYRTNMDIFGEGCENYIYDSDAFVSILEEALG